MRLKFKSKSKAGFEMTVVVRPNGECWSIVEELDLVQDHKDFIEAIRNLKKKGYKGEVIASS